MVGTPSPDQAEVEESRVGGGKDELKIGNVTQLEIFYVQYSAQMALFHAFIFNMYQTKVSLWSDKMSLRHMS